MALQSRPQSLSDKIEETLKYFDNYNYPLTLKELKLWSGLSKLKISSKMNYFFLPGRASLVKLRQEREKISLRKWQIAQDIGEKLKLFPTIAAVFVTGALAMNNSPKNDDVDLMIVTYPNCLWLTRFMFNLFFSAIRRYPNQTTAVNKICANLWLDSSNLLINNQSLYTAHEVLQAKLLWDRANIHSQFLIKNSWVKNYLEHAYKVQTAGVATAKKKVVNTGWLWPINTLFFLLQYLYMLPKKTSEKVGLGYAFFHPRG